MPTMTDHQCFSGQRHPYLQPCDCICDACIAARTERRREGYPRPATTLAEAFADTFGDDVPRPCVHCRRPTNEVASYFSDGGPESGPRAWTEPAHAECVAKMAAEADEYAQVIEAHERARMGNEAYDAMMAVFDAMDAEHEALEALPRVAGCSAAELSGECESCRRTTVLYAHDVHTIGYSKAPSAEVFVFHVCATCLGEDDHGPGCDGPYNCTCGGVA